MYNLLPNYYNLFLWMNYTMALRGGFSTWRKAPLWDRHTSNAMSGHMTFIHKLSMKEIWVEKGIILPQAQQMDHPTISVRYVGTFTIHINIQLLFYKKLLQNWLIIGLCTYSNCRLHITCIQRNTFYNYFFSYLFNHQRNTSAEITDL